MSNSAHLWAVGYDDADHTRKVRALVLSMAGDDRSLQVLEIAVLARSLDGSLTFNGNPFSTASHVVGYGRLGLLAGFALSVPMLSEDAVARMYGSATPPTPNALGITDEFKSNIASILSPGASALLVLDVAENMNAILPRLRGLGGTILKTNVDIERANLIQSTLAEKLA